MTSLTKKAIKDTFLELLEDRPLSQITVKDIVEKCGINRNSFYYHYQDIPALIEEIVTEEADKIIEEHPDVENLEDGFMAALDFAEKKRKAILHIFRSVNRDIFEHYLWKVCKYVTDMLSKNYLAGRKISVEEKAIILEFYRAQLFGVVIGWLNGGMKDDMRKSISRICELQQGVTEQMIGRCEKN